jgi:hypothetical protein
MHFEAIPTPKPRTPKQTTTATITAAITATTTAAITVITKKAKGRALPLERWYQRLGNLNHADVKQLATYSGQIKLANNKELFCEPCTYSKQYAIPNYKS